MGERVDIAALLAKPERARDLPREDRAQVLGLIEMLKAELLTSPEPPAAPHAGSPKERLLDVAEAAERCGMSEGWLYRHVDKLPFTRRVGRAVRFSETGLERWMATRPQPLRQAI